MNRECNFSLQPGALDHDRPSFVSEVMNVCEASLFMARKQGQSVVSGVVSHSHESRVTSMSHKSQSESELTTVWCVRGEFCIHDS